MQDLFGVDKTNQLATAQCTEAGRHCQVEQLKFKHSKVHDLVVGGSIRGKLPLCDGVVNIVNNYKDRLVSFQI